MLTEQGFIDLVTQPYEQKYLEFKAPGPRDSAYLFAQVTRAVLGMANLRGGGYVIIGVGQLEGRPDPIGLTPGDLATWRYDEVASRFATYADPPLDFDLTLHQYEGKQFIVLEVHEFEEVPVLCKADYQVPPAERHPREARSVPPILRAGACYVRSRRKPETSEVPTQTEMRELLNLAIEKGVRRYLILARAVGLDVPDDAIGRAQGPYPSVEGS